MIETLYNQQTAALTQRQRILIGIYKAKIQDGDNTIWASLWFELLLEANRELLRANTAVRKWQQSGMILR